MPRNKHDPDHTAVPPQNEEINLATNINTTTNDPFTATDFANLTVNEHYRYAPNSKKIGHAVILQKKGKTIAQQYDIPSSESDELPLIRELENIIAIEPFPGMNRFQAQTPNGTKMYAKRFIKGIFSDEDAQEQAFEIACFSPTNQDGKDPFWGSIKKTPLIKDGEVIPTVKSIKKGGEIVVDPTSVPLREEKVRNPDQNTVMNGSARDAYENFFNRMINKLHPEMQERLRRAFTANLNGQFFLSNFRPEWLHAKGWSLMPMDQDPQTQDNLGAGPKWANTQMMILERIVKWFALKNPQTLITIKPEFDMLLDSDLIQQIDFRVKIQLKERYVQLLQIIDPFLKYPQFAKATDLAQGTAITFDLLHDIPPVKTQELKKNNIEKSLEGSEVMKHEKKLNQNENTDREDVKKSRGGLKRKSSEDDVGFKAKRRPVADDLATDSETEEQAHKSIVSRKQNSKLRRIISDESISDIDSADKANKENLFPTHEEHEKSIMQIYTSGFSPNYEKPWQAPDTFSCTGSGVVIKNGNKKYILTNAHVVDNSNFLLVRFANTRLKKYEAKTKLVSYQCDLALLEVEDEEFNKLAEPIMLGEMTRLRQKVQVVGFPMGGDEISITEGVVSRIQVDDYWMSDEPMLEVQVDAAINPGNSGGPVFSDDKVVGISFQGFNWGESLGYIIPIPIIKHFITEAFSNKEYKGFPVLPIRAEPLENEYARRYYQMGDNTGIRIKKIDPLSYAFDKLKPDDILLAIDNLKISNEGTVDIPEIGNCISFIHVTHSKFIGDSVKLKILRHGKIKEVKVNLDCIPGDTKKIGRKEHDKMPTYFINSALCFSELTVNYAENFDNFDAYLLDEGCTLAKSAKSSPEERIVVVSNIIACKETQGYDQNENCIVKEINGIAIKNIRDVIKAMEENENPWQVVTLFGKSNTKIVVPNMDEEYLYELLERHHMPLRDRSDDLLSEKDLDEEIDASESDEASEHSSPVPAHDSRRSSVEEENIHYSHKKCKSRLPGLTHYQKVVQDLELRYKDDGEDVSEDDDSSFCAEDREEENSSANDDDENYGKRHAEGSASYNNLKRRSMHSFFTPIHRHNVEQEQPQKILRKKF